jgi:phage baseplate assembly protein W
LDLDLVAALSFLAPHLGFPISLTPDGRRLVIREQDSIEDIEDCVEVVLSTAVGERQEQPDYGTPDQAFRERGVDVGRLRAAVERWEPRAASVFTEEEITGMVQRVTARVGRRDIA